MNLAKRANIYHLSFESQALKSNSFGDPYVRTLPVYLPPKYDDKRREPYAVMFLLAGWSGRGENYLNIKDVFSASLPQRFDEAILSGELPPFIAVFPDSSAKLGSSQFVNSATVGRHMDYLCDELVPFIDQHFHTFKDWQYRGVLGHSSGGFGALVTAMLRPKVFGALCSSAGDSWYELLYVELIPKALACLDKAGGVETFVQKFWDNPNPMELLGPDSSHTMMLLNICACFAPNPTVPVIQGELYFDVETGALIFDVWQKICAWDPLRMVDQHYAELAHLRWLHLEAGQDDQYGLQYGQRQLAKKLSSYGIAHVLEEYPGKHSGHHHRYVSRIAKMLKAMGLA